MCSKTEKGSFRVQNADVESKSGGSTMLNRIDFKALDEKMKLQRETLRRRKLLGKVCAQMNAYPPTIERMLDSERMMYMKRVIDKVIFNFNILSYKHLYDGSVLHCNLDESFNEESLNEDFYALFLCKCNFMKYEDAINKLLNGNVVVAKRLLLKLVNEAVQPAFYAYALVCFKEMFNKCDVLNIVEENYKVMDNSKDDIYDAIQLLERAYRMNPVNYFLLGMMKRFNIGDCSRFMDESWKSDLCHVVSVSRDIIFPIEEDILTEIDLYNRWNREKCGLGMQGKLEYLKEISMYSLYELTLNTKGFYVNFQSELLQILNEYEFPESLYCYGATLLQTKSCKMSDKHIKQAMNYLHLAAAAGHNGSKFLLGTLPFYNNISYKLTQDDINRCIYILEDYISSSDGECKLNEKNIDKVSHCLAVEYYTKKSYVVQHDARKSEEILNSRKLYKELRDLQCQKLEAPKTFMQT